MRCDVVPIAAGDRSREQIMTEVNLALIQFEESHPGWVGGHSQILLLGTGASLAIFHEPRPEPIVHRHYLDAKHERLARVRAAVYLGDWSKIYPEAVISGIQVIQEYGDWVLQFNVHGQE